MNTDQTPKSVFISVHPRPNLVVLCQLIGFKLWRLIHYSIFIVYFSVTAHGLFAGTDTATPGMLGLYALTVLATYFLTVHRILVSVRQPRRQPG